MTKFKVGQVWADRKGRLREILIIDDTEYAILAKRVGVSRKDVFTIDGHLLNDREDPDDLITLIKDTEETVTEDENKELAQALQAIAKNTVSLPPEPVPGQYYRTRNNKKICHIGKMIDGTYLYQYCEPGECNGTFMYYSEPFHLSDKNELVDIIAPWTEPLPAIEIKRWAIVQVTDKRLEYRNCGGRSDAGFTDIKRGEVLKCSSDINYLKQNLKEDEEIVELVGILPPSDAGK
jgi:hypothetical protein